MKKVKTKSKLEWFKKNIVIVPVVAAIIAGTFTSVRYVLSLTDTITANQETIIKLEEKFIEYQKSGSVGAGKQNAKNTDQGKIKVSYTDIQKD